MDTQQFLKDIEQQPWYAGQIVHRERLNPQMALYAAPEAPLPPTLQSALERQGITRLYSHQAQALDAARAGRDLGIVTATASGKSLCFQLPVIEALAADYRRRALWLFPTKALAQDQLRALRSLTEGTFDALRSGIYDGDTPREERAALRASANIIISNPDMLHLGILPNHQRWRRFLSNLRYIVIDEAHIYRGVFGSHVALLLRRLLRMCAAYGSAPQIICASATIGNPAEHLAALTGREVQIIDESGAPRGGREIIFWNPPLLDAKSGARRSTNSETSTLLLELIERDVQSLTFAKARKVAELLRRYTSEALERSGKSSARLASYRAGYLAEERRAIERAMWSGELQALIATNAMELGVDIGGLDAVLLNGYPGTIASTWQQMGRAGRGQADSLAVIIAHDDPLDQFYMRHPEIFFARPHEQALVSLDNPYILAEHLRCAAYEQPLSEEDERWFGPSMFPLAGELIEEGLLLERLSRVYAPVDSYPADDVDIRSASGELIELVDEESGGVIERIDTGRALYELHPGAVHLHQGQTYLVTDLDLAERRAIGRRAELDYYTQPRDVTDVQVLQVLEQRELGDAVLCFGEVDISRRVVGYRRKAHYTEEILGDHELDLPPQSFATHAIWFTIPQAQAQALAERDADLPGGLHAAEHAMIGMLPLLAMCDRRDIGGVSTPWHPDTGRPTIFIYDGVPGGVGITETGYAHIERWWSLTLTLLCECPCESGCPACVHSWKCGNNNNPLDKQVAAELLGGFTILCGLC